MNDHLLERVSRAQMGSGCYPALTATIVAFAGGTGLGGLINTAVQDALVGGNMIETSSSSKRVIFYSMDFVQENYGIATPAVRTHASDSAKPITGGGIWAQMIFASDR